MRWMIVVLGLFTFTVTGFSAVAAIPRSSNVEFKGGQAGSLFSIRNIQLIEGKQLSRLVLEVGDGTGQALKGLPAYYHAVYSPQTHTLALDISQTPISKVSHEKLAELVKRTPFVEKSEMLIDPMDSTLSLEFKLKKGTKARVMQVRGQKMTAKIVVDFFSEGSL